MSDITVVFDALIPIPPVSWKRTETVAIHTRGGVRIKHFNEKKYRQAKNNLGWEIKCAAPALRVSEKDRFGFRVKFLLPRARGGDGDRYENLLMDALEGIVWANDEQVDEGSWAKAYNCSIPGIKLTIWRIT